MVVNEVMHMDGHAMPTEPANILLVDDRPANLTALEAILKPLGENLVHATSGREALRHILTTDFAVILMDVQMPDMDGLETAALIRERDQSRLIPIIFITAINTEDQYVFHGYSVGAVDYITKPFDPTILSSKVSVFVELYKKEKLLRERTQLLHEKELEALRLLQKEREQELEKEHIKELNRILEQKVQERTAELEAFCYSISHDLRTPLRTIDGFSASLADDLNPVLDEQQRDSLGRVRKAAQKMDMLITALLALSRITRSELQPTAINLTNLAQSLEHDFRSRTPERNVELRVQEEMTITGDPALMRSVFVNLLANAWKFTSKKEEALIEIGCFVNENQQCVYFVKDNGAGFQQEYAHRLFKPFERLHTEREFPGDGIGLATVSRIVQKHGGTIWAEGAPDEGAQFFFVLD